MKRKFIWLINDSKCWQWFLFLFPLAGRELKIIDKLSHRRRRLIHFECVCVRVSHQAEQFHLRTPSSTTVSILLRSSKWSHRWVDNALIMPLFAIGFCQEPNGIDRMCRVFIECFGNRSAAKWQPKIKCDRHNVVHRKFTYVSANELKMFAFDDKFTREPSEMPIGDVVSEIGPPTSIGESAFGVLGLSAEFWDVLKIKEKVKSFNRLNFVTFKLERTCSQAMANRRFQNMIANADVSSESSTIVVARNRNLFVDSVALHWDARRRYRQQCRGTIHGSRRSCPSWSASSRRCLVFSVPPSVVLLCAILHDDSGTKPAEDENKRNKTCKLNFDCVCACVYKCEQRKLFRNSVFRLQQISHFTRDFPPMHRSIWCRIHFWFLH